MARQLVRLFTVRRYQVLILTLFAMSFLVMDTYSEIVMKEIPVAVLDMDNSSISRTIRHYLEATREVSIRQIDVLSLEDAERLFKENAVAAIVLIPHDLATQIKKGKEPQVTVAIDMANILLGKNVYKGIKQAIGTVSAGVQLTYLKKKGVKNENALPKVVPISVDTNFTYNPATNYVIYICPGILFFLFHVFFLILITSTWIPGTAEETLAGRAGALLTVFVFCFGLALLILYVLLDHVDIYPQTSFDVILPVLLVFMVLDVMLAMALASIIPNKLTSMQVTVVAGMLSMMGSGITWPTSMFPYWMQKVVDYIPFTPFARSFQSFLHYPMKLEELSFAFDLYMKEGILFAALIAIGLLRMLISARKKEAA